MVRLCLGGGEQKLLSLVPELPAQCWRTAVLAYLMEGLLSVSPEDGAVSSDYMWFKTKGVTRD